MSKQDIKNASLRKEIGKRFKEFRQSIKKTQYEFVVELRVCKSTVSNIETGKAFPGITIKNYLYRQYRLNINWLLTGKGEMIISPKEGSYFTQLFSHIDENDPRFEKYVELKSLLRIPVLEKVIFGKMEELKLIAKKDIDSFFEEE
jgi:transcriptional regulator with XRE-family HTH domain